MIVALGFGAPEALDRERAVRRPVFEARSTLPPQAACLVANGVREALAHLLARELEVGLIEPRCPGRDERSVLFAQAHAVRVRGRLCDAVVAVRPLDARRLAALAFHERERPDHGVLSTIELHVVEKTLHALAALCAPLCGSLGAAQVEPPARAVRECTTYFEVRTSGDPPIGIGFGLTADPPEEIGRRVALEGLLDVRLEGRIELADGRLALPALAALATGAPLELGTRVDEPGRLRIGAVTVAHGTCGIRAAQRAFVVSDVVSGTLA